MTETRNGLVSDIKYGITEMNPWLFRMFKDLRTIPSISSTFSCRATDVLVSYDGWMFSRPEPGFSLALIDKSE